MKRHEPIWPGEKLIFVFFSNKFECEELLITFLDSLLSHQFLFRSLILRERELGEIRHFTHISSRTI